MFLYMIYPFFVYPIRTMMRVYLSKSVYMSHDFPSRRDVPARLYPFRPFYRNNNQIFEQVYPSRAQAIETK